MNTNFTSLSESIGPSCIDKLYGQVFPVYMDFFMIISVSMYGAYQLLAIFVLVKLRETLTRNNKMVIHTFSVCLLLRFAIYILGYRALAGRPI